MENLEISTEKEYILAGDISFSMTSVDPACGGQTRYEYMLEKFQNFIQIAQDLDEHGAPTVLLFGERVHTFDHMKLDEVRPKLTAVKFEGFTNLDLAIEQAYDLHCEDKRELARKKEFHPGTHLMVFTDGDPSNKTAVERMLFRIVKEIDTQDEFQITFLTVGTVTKSLQAWLNGLHDLLEDERDNPRDFDIIHVSKLEDTTFTDALKANRHVA